MYAIVEAGGRQWKVEPGTRFEVNRLAAEVGSTHTVERVLLARDGQELKVGRPYLEGAAVVCEVQQHRLGEKTVTYRFRRRENWRKTVGHRQPLTRLVVKEIRLGGAAPAAAAVAAEPKPASRPRAPKAAATAAKTSAVVRKKPSLQKPAATPTIRRARDGA
jgi:large subunit ribosomal protein L21